MKPMVLLLGFLVFVDNFNFAQFLKKKFGDLCMLQGHYHTYKSTWINFLVFLAGVP
jgi:hypothetical protein